MYVRHVDISHINVLEIKLPHNMIFTLIFYFSDLFFIYFFFYLFSLCFFAYIRDTRKEENLVFHYFWSFSTSYVIKIICINSSILICSRNKVNSMKIQLLTRLKEICPYCPADVSHKCIPRIVRVHNTHNPIETNFNFQRILRFLIFRISFPGNNLLSEFLH